MSFNDNQYSPYFNTSESADTGKKFTYENVLTSETEFEGHKNCGSTKLTFQSPLTSIASMYEDCDVSNKLSTRSSSEKKIFNLFNTKDKVKAQQKCKDHPDEDLLFICYNCDKKSVCIECVSNGCHKSHDVKNLKKAIKDVKGLLEQNLFQLKQKIESYVGEVDKLSVKKNEVVEQNNELNSAIQHQFSEIKKAIYIKERELMATFDLNQTKKQRQLDDLIMGFRRKINIYIQSHKTIEQITKEFDDQQLCQYYHNKQKDLNILCKFSKNQYNQNETSQIQKMLGGIEELKCVFNMSGFNQITDILAAMHIQTCKVIQKDLLNSCHNSKIFEVEEKDEVEDTPNQSSWFDKKRKNSIKKLNEEIRQSSQDAKVRQSSQDAGVYKTQSYLPQNNIHCPQAPQRDITQYVIQKLKNLKEGKEGKGNTTLRGAQNNISGGGNTSQLSVNHSVALMGTALGNKIQTMNDANQNYRQSMSILSPQHQFNTYKIQSEENEPIKQIWQLTSQGKSMFKTTRSNNNKMEELQSFFKTNQLLKNTPINTTIKNNSIERIKMDNNTKFIDNNSKLINNSIERIEQKMNNNSKLMDNNSKLFITEQMQIKTKLNSQGNAKFIKGGMKNEDIFNFLKNNMKQPKKG